LFAAGPSAKWRAIMRVLFCRPEAAQDVDDRFELEADALDELGRRYDLISMEQVVDEELDAALDPIGSLEGDRVLYRGWMLTSAEYERLEEAVAARGGSLVTTTDEYEAAHYLPAWFDAVAALSPATRWIEGADPDEAWEAAQELGPPPYVIKDHVKSAKEHWHEACFVPAGADRATFARVCSALVDLRADRFERGLVIRRYVPLAPAPGGQGEADEHRLFFWRGKLVGCAPYHDVAADVPVPRRFGGLGRVVDSPFFTVDVARTIENDWIVLEVGDGGVSTLPPTMDPRTLYRAIR
jgi:hypothetical protein